MLVLVQLLRVWGTRRNSVQLVTTRISNVPSFVRYRYTLTFGAAAADEEEYRNWDEKFDQVVSTAVPTSPAVAWIFKCQQNGSETDPNSTRRFSLIVPTIYSFFPSNI